MAVVVVGQVIEEHELPWKAPNLWNLTRIVKHANQKRMLGKKSKKSKKNKSKSKKSKKAKKSKKGKNSKKSKRD